MNKKFEYFYTNVYMRGNFLYVIGYVNGKRFEEKHEYKPYLFVPTPEESEYHNVFGRPVKRLEFNTMRDAREFLKQQKDVDNSEVYGLNNFPYVYINDEFPGQEIDYNPNLISIISLDIEVAATNGMPDVEVAVEEVTAITMVKRGRVITFGCKYYKPEQDHIQYILCDDEVDLLKKFVAVWTSDEWKPDIITGWSSDMFDIPYLVRRIERVLGNRWVKYLSPWGFVEEREIVRAKGSAASFGDRVEKVYEIAGITQLDYLQLYKKYTFTNQESYALNNIAQKELGEKKVDYSEYRNLDELYEKNFEKFITYNIHDAMLVERLDKKMGFINLVLALTYKAKVNMIDTMTTIRSWDVIIHNYLMERKIVVPQYKKKNFRPFEGAYVKDVHIGLHKWIVSFDATSLYPSVISQVNISPETYVKTVSIASVEHIIERKLVPEYEGNFSLAANGALYRKDVQGFLGVLVDKFIADRKVIKKKQLALEAEKEEQKVEGLDDDILKLYNYQWALKILTNGLYGALGNQYFRWFEVIFAESITKTGQLVLQWAETHMNAYLNKTLKTEGVDYIVAGDTDSIYVNLGPLVDKCGMSGERHDKVVEFLDKVCKTKIRPYLDGRMLELSEMLKSYHHKFDMKQEAICSKAIFRGKKMYILNVHSSEGVTFDEPKIKMKGIEAVRSSTPMSCRNAIKDALKIIMNKEEPALHDFIRDFEKKFYAMPFVDIAFPRTCNNLMEYYDKDHLIKPKCPIAVHAAHVYNMMLQKFDLTKKYPLVRNKDKIKFAYLKTDNPTGHNVIAMGNEMPEEFKIEEFVDRTLQFEKAFLSPIRSITDVIGWHVKPQADENLFYKDAWK